MQDSRINYVVVGAFVAAMLVAFIAVITLLAGRGGPSDDYYTVYGNVGGTWTEQAKLVPPTTGPDAGVGTPTFGSAVSLSADGGTALIGGQSDNQRGAAWVFTRTSATAWSEQAKLTAPTSGATAEIGQGFLGASVALSADATTAVVGAPFDNSAIGAAYAFGGSGSTWSLRSKLTAPAGSDAELGSGVFGDRLALSGDGPLLELAGIEEYLAPLAPRVVLWLHYHDARRKCQTQQYQLAQSLCHLVWHQPANRSAIHNGLGLQRERHEYASISHR